MLQEKWKDVLNNIKDSFEVLDEGQEEYDDEGGVLIEYIDFIGPMGKMKLEFITKPVIVDKKVNYSKRIGSESDVKYIYSETEYTSKMIAYRWDGEDWEEIDGKMFKN